MWPLPRSVRGKGWLVQRHRLLSWISLLRTFLKVEPWPCQIEIGFKRAVKLWWFTKEREFFSILRQTTQMQFLPLHLQPPCACFRPIQKQNHRGGEGLPEGSRLDSIVVSAFVGILVKRQEDLSFPVLKQGRWYYVTRIVSCFATLLSAEVVAVHRRG